MSVVRAPDPCRNCVRSDAVLKRTHNDGHYVWCRNCGAMSDVFASRWEAENHWEDLNLRVPAAHTSPRGER